MNRKRIVPGPGQESVWDYPRPPAVEVFSGHIRVIYQGAVIVDSNAAYRVLETSHPPTYYLPMSAFMDGVLKVGTRQSYCEFKGRASYVDVILGDTVAKDAGWFYPNPSERFSVIKDHVSLYAQYMDACFVSDQRVAPQEGDFYGGWITPNVVGPFKGAAGTWGW